MAGLDRMEEIMNMSPEDDGTVREIKIDPLILLHFCPGVSLLF